MPAKLLAKSAVFSWRLSDANDDDAAYTRDVGRQALPRFHTREATTGDA